MSDKSYLPSNDDFMMLDDSFLTQRESEIIPSIHETDLIGSSSITAAIASQSGVQPPAPPANSIVNDDT